MAEQFVQGTLFEGCECDAISGGPGSLGRKLEVVVLAYRKFPVRLDFAMPTITGHLIAYADHPELIFLDDRLNEVERLRPPNELVDDRWLDLAISFDDTLIAIVSERQLRVIDRRGTLLYECEPCKPHEWGHQCCFDWQKRLWYIPPRQKRDNDEIAVIDACSRETLARGKVSYGHVQVFRCPTPAYMMIQVGRGQDGGYLYLASCDGKNLTIRKLACIGCTFQGGFAPKGHEIVTCGDFDEVIRVHSMPNGCIAASLDTHSLFRDHPSDGEYRIDRLGRTVLFDNRILAGTLNGRLLVIDAINMQFLGVVWPKGYSFEADEVILSGSDGHFTQNCNLDLVDFYFAKPGELLIRQRGNRLRILDVAPLGRK